MSGHTVVIGGGITGLTLGWSLLKQPDPSFTVLESSHRPGGWIRTQRKQGFLFEQGPHSFRTSGGIETLQLIEELGLQEEFLPAAQAAQKRFLLANNQLQAVPSSMLAFLFSPLTRPLLPALLREWRRPKGAGQDESIHSFISRRLGNALAEQLIDPLVSGIYAGDMHVLSIQACFPRMHQWEQEYSSLTKGALKALFSKRAKPIFSDFVEKALKTPLFSLRQGMESLPQAIAQQLGSHLKLSSACTGIEKGEKYVTVHIQGQPALLAQRVYLTTPISTTIALLRAAGCPLSAQANLPGSASVTVVNLAWKKKLLKGAGFGYLVPSQAKQDILGVIWDSAVFPSQNCNPEETRLTVMMGGAHRPELTQIPDDVSIELALKALTAHMGITVVPDAVSVTVAKNAIPQYGVGHAMATRELEAVVAKWSAGRIIIKSSGWHGVSLNDCIKSCSIKSPLSH